MIAVAPWKIIYRRHGRFNVGLETQIVMRGIFIPGRWRDKGERREGKRERGGKRTKRGRDKRMRATAGGGRERDEKQQACQRH